MSEPDETQRLRSAIDKALAGIEGKFSATRLSRALVAKACDISIANDGHIATVWMTERATNLLAGHWSRESVQMYIEHQR